MGGRLTEGGFWDVSFFRGFIDTLYTINIGTYFSSLKTVTPAMRIVDGSFSLGAKISPLLGDGRCTTEDAVMWNIFFLLTGSVSGTCAEVIVSSSSPAVRLESKSELSVALS